MKVLENLKFSEFSEMNDREMKRTTGGYYGSGGSGNVWSCFGLNSGTCGGACRTATMQSGICEWTPSSWGTAAEAGIGTCQCEEN